MDLNIAIVQYNIVWEDDAANLKIIEGLLLNYSQELDLIILPEMFNCGFTMDPEKHAQNEEGEVLAWMKRMSHKFGAAITGSVAVKSDVGFVNRLYFVNGNKVGSYDKRHLFTMGGEHKSYSPGKQRLLVNLKGWKICPLICYDLRFPVWSRNDCDYDLLLYVANWPSARRDVWNALLTARALENQTYVVGVNRVGKDISNVYSGDSQVIDAKGQQLLRLDEKEQISYVTLCKSDLKAFRDRFPVLDDRDHFKLSDC